jgi:hypothetical protein
MKKLMILLVFMLVACDVYGPELLECPEVVAWYPQGPDQCGYTVNTLPNVKECNTLINWSVDGCASSQERICAMSVHVTQYVDPVKAWCNTIIETADGCTAVFDGPLKVK